MASKQGQVEKEKPELSMFDLEIVSKIKAELTKYEFTGLV
ncbi:hypothetical protein CCACVL1_25870 [Corchorus capsularis]|uniref:Uncharacterized protein n=1 Tax=Corchorus capsularis TaxID=210143 RepID=A0A1R3GGN9_COCAP|nr:hypothetical protein CCACVL1_25870 [Corchorus capsularis]